MKNLFKSASCGNPAKFVWEEFKHEFGHCDGHLGQDEQDEKKKLLMTAFEENYPGVISFLESVGEKGSIKEKMPPFFRDFLESVVELGMEHLLARVLKDLKKALFNIAHSVGPSEHISNYVENYRNMTIEGVRKSIKRKREEGGCKVK